ncbi:unnamed protein product [Boreogadus saida]
MKMNCKPPSLDFRIFLRSAQVEDTLELYKVKKVTCSLSQGVCLLTQSNFLSEVLQNRSVLCLKGEAERLWTGGLWCQGGLETGAGDQEPAAPDQRTRNPWLKELMENEFLERRRAGRGAVNLEDDHHSTNKDCLSWIFNCSSVLFGAIPRWILLLKSHPPSTGWSSEQMTSFLSSG